MSLVVKLYGCPVTAPKNGDSHHGQQAFDDDNGRKYAVWTCPHAFREPVSQGYLHQPECDQIEHFRRQRIAGAEPTAYEVGIEFDAPIDVSCFPSSGAA